MDLIDRYEAKALGRKRFFTGQPCLRGHEAPRYTSNGACVECQNFKTPSKLKPSPVHYLPERALFFGNCEGATATLREAIAVFRYMEIYGWHLTALKALRADPALFTKLSGPREAYDTMFAAAARAQVEAMK